MTGAVLETVAAPPLPVQQSAALLAFPVLLSLESTPWRGGVRLFSGDMGSVRRTMAAVRCCQGPRGALGCSGAEACMAGLEVDLRLPL